MKMRGFIRSARSMDSYRLRSEPASDVESSISIEKGKHPRTTQLQPARECWTAHRNFDNLGESPWSGGKERWSLSEDV